MTKEKKAFTPPTQEEIAAYAYQLWEADGRRHGRDLDHWLQAQAHLMADRQYEAGLLAESAKQPAAAAKKLEPPTTKTPVKPEKRKKVEVRPSLSASKSAFA